MLRNSYLRLIKKCDFPKKNFWPRRKVVIRQTPMVTIGASEERGIEPHRGRLLSRAVVVVVCIFIQL